VALAAPESLRIDHRPEEIEGRLVSGHREGDPPFGACRAITCRSKDQRGLQSLVSGALLCNALSTGDCQINHREVGAIVERKTLGWKTPEETMAEELEVIKPNVAVEI